MSSEEKIRKAGKAFVKMLLVIRKQQDEIYQERRLVEYLTTGKSFAGLTKGGPEEAFAKMFTEVTRKGSVTEYAGLSQRVKQNLDNKLWRLRFYKDWHVDADVKSIVDLRNKTLGWGPKRRGESLERWLIQNKKRGTKIPKVAVEAENDLIRELDIDLGKIQREADLYRIRSHTMWEDKHYLEGTIIDKEQLKAYVDVLNLELDAYLQEINAMNETAEEISASVEASRLCYVFSTQTAAGKNLDYIKKQLGSVQQVKQYANGTTAAVSVSSKLRQGKSVKVFYLDDQSIMKRLGEVIGQ